MMFMTCSKSIKSRIDLKHVDFDITNLILDDFVRNRTSFVHQQTDSKEFFQLKNDFILIKNRNFDVFISFRSFDLFEQGFDERQKRFFVECYFVEKRGLLIELCSRAKTNEFVLPQRCDFDCFEFLIFLFLRFKRIRRRDRNDNLLKKDIEDEIDHLCFINRDFFNFVKKFRRDDKNINEFVHCFERCRFEHVEIFDRLILRANYSIRHRTKSRKESDQYVTML